MFVQAQSTGVLSSLDPPPGGKLWANATEWPSYIGPSLIEPDHDDNQTEILGLNHQSLQIGHHLFTEATKSPPQLPSTWSNWYNVFSPEPPDWSSSVHRELRHILHSRSGWKSSDHTAKELGLSCVFSSDHPRIWSWLCVFSCKSLAICCCHQIIQTSFQCEVRSSSTEHLFAAKIWRRFLDSPKILGSMLM